MTIAYWCVLVAALLPIGTVMFARSGSGGNNHTPWTGIDDLPAPRRRAYAAHRNSYENFPFFAAAVIIATTTGAPVYALNVLAAIYVALRLAFTWLYVNDVPAARSAVFSAALLVNIAIFVLPAFR